MVINIIVNRVEQHKMKKYVFYWSLIDSLCFESKNLYNYANYLIRQEFISKQQILTYKEVLQICKNSEPYKNMGSNIGQETLRMLDKAWKSFLVSIKDWSTSPSKYLGKPKLPKYKNKDGRFTSRLDNNKFKIIDGYIYFCWKKLKCMNNTFKTNIPSDSKLMQIRFVPQGSDYIMEVVYQIEVPESLEITSHIASIDLGIDNFATITNNIGLQPIVVKGGIIKSINQYYNKRKAEIQSELKKVSNKDWSKKLQRLTTKRNNKVKNFMHIASKRVVDYCVLYGIDTLVCGLNKTWKQESNMNKQNNQNFVSIPYDMFIKQLAYKCENNSIRFITTEESYTSGTSFLDGEEPCKENYNKSRRVHRGLFISNGGIKINADVNGSYQIMRKVFPDAFANGIEGVCLHPMTMKIA